MASERVAIFIDGGYFDFVIRQELNMARLDYGKLALKLANDANLLRTYYYHCMPYQSSRPTAVEAERYSHMRSFVYMLNKQTRFEVKLGDLAYRGLDKENKPIFEQKRVDILLGVDLVLLSAKQQISKAIVLAGDSDFLPAIDVAKNEGVLIHLYHGVKNSPHKDLWERCDERTPITPQFCKDILRPRQ